MMSAENLLVYSPRGVLDTRVFEMDGDKLDYLRTPFSSCSDLPPVSCLSVESSTPSSSDEDDSSSVSSVSLEDGDALSLGGEKRMIFASYWSKKGGKPKPLHVESCSLTEDLTIHGCESDDSSSSDSAASEENSYEKLLQKSEAAPAPLGCRNSGMRRRRLFSNNVYTHSEPSLAVCALETKPSCIRKSQSTTEVEGERRPSILREGRYSGSVSNKLDSLRSSERSSVSFCEDVRVEFLKPETEKWAAKGWSKYFM
jgi:hypothetical protein